MNDGIARVFPRRTKATPTDDLAFVGEPPFELPEVSEVHISVAFTWDKLYAEHLCRQWASYYDTVLLGGPAYHDKGGSFEPGLYLKEGYTITSRGCPNRCSFCMAWKREGQLRTLAIKPGWIVLDNNLLACPRPHVEAVLDMLSHQRRKAEFSGGLEAARVEPWFVQRVTEIGFHRLYLAYDRPGERKPVADALRQFREAGVKHSRLSCFVLVGYEGDTLGAAAERCQFVKDNGGVPFPMYFRPDGAGWRPPRDWEDFCGKILHCPGGKSRVKDEAKELGLWSKA